MKIRKITRPYTWIAVLAWAVYSATFLFSPVDSAAMHMGIEPWALQSVLIGVYLLLLVSWYFVITTCINFWNYTRTLPNGSLQLGFFFITMGLFVLAFDLIVPGTVSVVYSYMSGDAYDAERVSFIRYSEILIPLLCYLLIYIGSLKLVSRTDQDVSSFSKLVTAVLPAGVLSVFYAYLIFTDPAQNAENPTSSTLIITTIMLPSIISWTIGLLMILNLGHYSHHTRSINRRSFGDFYNGILIIVAVTILLQSINSIGATRFLDFEIGFVGFMLFAIMIAMMFGLALTARGSKNLKKMPAKNSK